MAPAGPPPCATHDQPPMMPSSKRNALSSSSSPSPYKSASADLPGGPHTARRRITASMLWRRSSSWAFPALVSLCLVLLTRPATSRTTASVTADAVDLAARTESSLKDNGLTDVVQWDNYTIFLHGQRTFIQ